MLLSMLIYIPLNTLGQDKFSGTWTIFWMYFNQKLCLIEILHEFFFLFSIYFLIENFGFSCELKFRIFM